MNKRIVGRKMEHNAPNSHIFKGYKANASSMKEKNDTVKQSATERRETTSSNRSMSSQYRKEMKEQRSHDHVTFVLSFPLYIVMTWTYCLKLSLGARSHSA